MGNVAIKKITEIENDARRGDTNAEFAVHVGMWFHEKINNQINCHNVKD